MLKAISIELPEDIIELFGEKELERQIKEKARKSALWIHNTIC